MEQLALSRLAAFINARAAHAIERSRRIGKSLIKPGSHLPPQLKLSMEAWRTSCDGVFSVVLVDQGDAEPESSCPLVLLLVGDRACQVQS